MSEYTNQNAASPGSSTSPVHQEADHGSEQIHGHSHAHAHDHDHLHDHSHSHTHDPEEVKKVINRLARSIGHLQSVKRMVENGVDCSDVLIQLAAVRAELNNAGKVLLKQHLEHCIADAIEENDTAAIDKMNSAIDKFMK
jgi:DNA-binding FrmR family transcriptional regulator